uniref:Glucagon / GIP / secretin / VIP family domain-containing protein n=1 Tax=Ciona savignyi TaxID=51511 RepID=H2ZDR2_CIOSA
MLIANYLSCSLLISFIVVCQLHMGKSETSIARDPTFPYENLDLDVFGSPGFGGNYGADRPKQFYQHTNLVKPRDGAVEKRYVEGDLLNAMGKYNRYRLNQEKNAWLRNIINASYGKRAATQTPEVNDADSLPEPLSSTFDRDFAKLSARFRNYIQWKQLQDYLNQYEPSVSRKTETLQPSFSG